MILNREDSFYAANIFTDYFKNFNRIDDYLRRIKLERMESFGNSLPGIGPETDMFSDFDIHPNDMDIIIKTNTKSSEFDMYLQYTSSHCNETSIPGKTFKWIVLEKNTKKIIGFIRLGSPTINSKPRNDFLGKPLDTMNSDVMARFNSSAIMGFVIIPTQPFGYNYLGGKLLAGIACSHFTRRECNKKYGGPFCMFETTSLYGSTKSSSQYDGMKPFLRYKGLTDSDFLPLLNDSHYVELKYWFKKRNNNTLLVPNNTTSKKLKTQTMMISIIKKSLKMHDENSYKNFCEICDSARKLTERKRQYMSDYGYENVKEYLNFETDTLIKKENFDRFELESIIDWWKIKAARRYETLKKEGKLRKNVETWNNNPESIDIIR